MKHYRYQRKFVYKNLSFLHRTICFITWTSS